MIDDKSTAESLGSTRTYGQVRCMNPTCVSRITPQPGQTTAKCPKCGSEWRIFWVKAGFPRVRGPVWETSLKMANAQWAKVATSAAEDSSTETKE